MDVTIVGAAWTDYAIFRALDVLFTVVLVAVIAFTLVRLLKVVSVTFKVDIDGRDQDRSD